VTVRCERCGIEYGVGCYPFCKGGHGRYNVNVIDDNLEGGARFFETLGPDPVWIESKSQWRREVAARDLVNVDKHDRAYYDTRFKRHVEQLKDTGRYSDHGLV
jgi:hypothetical protein